MARTLTIDGIVHTIIEPTITVRGTMIKDLFGQNEVPQHMADGFCTGNSVFLHKYSEKDTYWLLTTGMDFRSGWRLNDDEVKETVNIQGN